jgi:molybdopterin molybdotransferase
VTPLADALAAYGSVLRALPVERCPLSQALHRVLAGPATSAVDLPPFTQSAVDGYALRATDAGLELTLIGEVPAGSPAVRALGPGTGMRILTGGMLPRGADTVARQEIVERHGERIRIVKGLAAGADTRHRGEELGRGAELASAGQRLDAGLIAALAMAGVREVGVRRRPRIAVLITGDELARDGAALAPGQVHDANGPLLRHWLVERGYGEPQLEYVADTPEAVRAALARALGHADLVLSTGGVSVGDRDYLPQLAPELGVEKVFWQVAQKPGKPLWFGTRGSTGFLGIPGNPAAVLVCLTVHVAAALAVLEGCAAPPWHRGRLAAPVKADARRDRLVRAQRSFGEDGGVSLKALPKQDSHMLSNLAAADTLLWLSARGADYAPGDVVRWCPLRTG